jgi:hypothetical protein
LARKQPVGQRLLMHIGALFKGDGVHTVSGFSKALLAAHPKYLHWKVHTFTLSQASHRFARRNGLGCLACAEKALYWALKPSANQRCPGAKCDCTT